MKRIYILMLMFFAVCMLSGCVNYAKDYNKNTLVVRNNNSIVDISVEDFKGTNITPEGLDSYIDEQIDMYNEENESNLIRKTTIDTEDMGNVKLVLTYKDMESYNGFNSLDCILDDVYNVDTGKLKGNYTSMEDNESISFDSIPDVDDYKVLVMSENTDVVIKGDILYYNEEVTVNDGIATCSGKNDAIIIFK